jgi:hypothetical protein
MPSPIRKRRRFASLRLITLTLYIHRSYASSNPTSFIATLLLFQSTCVFLSDSPAYCPPQLSWPPQGLKALSSRESPKFSTEPRYSCNHHRHHYTLFYSMHTNLQHPFKARHNNPCVLLKRYKFEEQATRNQIANLRNQWTHHQNLQPETL